MYVDNNEKNSSFVELCFAKCKVSDNALNLSRLLALLSCQLELCDLALFRDFNAHKAIFLSILKYRY